MCEEVVNKSPEQFYSDAETYWSTIPATVDGMLGGFGFISKTDIVGSRMFLKQLFRSKRKPDNKYALDCGAGIGRISKHLLTDMFEKTDLVEQNPTFLENAKQYLGPDRLPKIGNFYSVGLQHFKPEREKYDIIWIQWVLGHLTDTDLINFLKSCQNGLKLNGLIVIKENVTSSLEIEMDEKDSSVTRPIGEFHRLFNRAGLECYRQHKQNNFPKGIYSVYMFALRPVKINSDIPVEMVSEEKLKVGTELCKCHSVSDESTNFEEKTGTCSCEELNI